MRQRRYRGFILKKLECRVIVNLKIVQNRHWRRVCMIVYCKVLRIPIVIEIGLKYGFQ